MAPERNGSRLAVFFKLLTAYAILPNLPFMIAAHFVHVQRAIINLDYIAWGVAAVWLPWPVVLCGATVVIVIDVLESFCGVYYLNVADAFSSFANLSHLSVFFVVSTTIIVLGGISLLALAVTWVGYTPRRRTSSLMLVFILAAFCMADSLNGTSVFSNRQSVIVPVNLVGSTGFQTSRQLIDYTQELRSPASHAASVESATGVLLPASMQDQPRENIVLIIEESLGLAMDPSLNDAVLSPLFDESIKSRYKVETGSVPFHGSTVAGEFRELCGAGLGLRSRDAAAGALTGCLPGRLRAEGYSVEALHGFTARMFGRDQWYPKIGFDHFTAAEQLPELGKCGIAFKGICDDQLALLIREHLQQTSAAPRFTYWLTLNSHLPVDPGLASSDNMSCDSLPELRENADVCDLARVLHWTNSAIAHLASTPGLPSTRFIIVGDHAPPFLSRNKRALFSQERVPYISLVPRDSGIPTRRPQLRLASKRPR